MIMKNFICNEIIHASAKVCVIGVGYVGLPLLLAVSKAGFRAIGYDINQARIDQLNSGESGLSHIPNTELQEYIQSGKLTFTSNVHDANGSQIFVICVPTPLDELGLPDNSYIDSAMASISSIVYPGCLVSLESTTYPGTTRETVCTVLEAKDLVVGTDAFVCFSPEREDPGRKTHTLATTPKIVGGVTEACGYVASAFYQKFVNTVVKVSSPEIAETSKLIENTSRAVNIALANELKGICDVLSIDFYEAMDAAATKPFGFAPYYPGPGVGGHCIPIDPFYLTWKTAQVEKDKTPLIDKALLINETAHFRTIDALTEALTANGISIFSKPTILLIGAAYKPGVEDVRESPFFKIAEQLLSLGVVIEYHDPMVPSLELSGMIYNSVDEFLGYDGAIIVTNQPMVNYEDLRLKMPFVIDSRRSYSKPHFNVIRA